MGKFLQMKVGQTATVIGIRDDLPGTEALRRLGLHEGAELKILAKGSPFLVLCNGAKLALDPALLDAVDVWSLDANDDSGEFFGGACDLESTS